MSEGNPSEATPDLTAGEIEALSELVDLAEHDPGLLREIISEEARQSSASDRSAAEGLLEIIQNHTEHRQEQDRALLDGIFSSMQAQEESGQE